MKISNKNIGLKIGNFSAKSAENNIVLQNKKENPYTTSLNQDNLVANYCPLAFKGNASEIKRAYILTPSGEDVPIEPTQNSAYCVEYDSQTHVIYGKSAIEYLNNNSEFQYDTQIVIPKHTKGVLSVDGKTIPLEENSAVMISAKSKAKISIEQGYPFIIQSKRNLDWYKKYSGSVDSEGFIVSKFNELSKINSHSYNGEVDIKSILPPKFSNREFLNSLNIVQNDGVNLFLEISKSKDLLSQEDKEDFVFVENLLNKLKMHKIIDDTDFSSGFIKFTRLYNSKYAAKFFKEKGFSEKEMNIILPLMEKSRQLRMQSRVSRRGTNEGLTPDLISKMKNNSLIYNVPESVVIDEIFWKKEFEDKEELITFLKKHDFNDAEIESIIKNWDKTRKTGFDLTGLKYIDSNLAVYDFKEKLNNWGLGKTDWVTNSTALATSNGETPFVGVSIVQANENKIYDINELRQGEHLHKHPNREEKRQTELYLITSGSAALNIVKDNKSQVKVLKQGDLVVVSPGLAHCVNIVKGEYEQIVAQVPSAFQYGFGFKENLDLPFDYDESALKQHAIERLE